MLKKYRVFIAVFCILTIAVGLLAGTNRFRNLYVTGFLWTGLAQRVPRFESSFESVDEIEKHFILNKIERRCWSLTDKYRSHGDKSLAIRIRSGDHVTLEKGARKGVERADFQDALFVPLYDPKFSALNPKLDIWHRIDFMILDEASFPIMDERLVFLHFKQVGGNNPLFSMRYRNGILMIKRRDANRKETYLGPRPEMDKWYRVVVHSKITKTDDGFMDVYLDDVQIARYVGKTAYPKQPPFTYNKFGLYRDFYVDEDRKLPPMTIYFDRYIRGASWKEVVPEGGPMPAYAQDTLWPSSIRTVDDEGDGRWSGNFWASDEGASGKNN